MFDELVLENGVIIKVVFVFIFVVLFFFVFSFFLGFFFAVDDQRSEIWDREERMKRNQLTILVVVLRAMQIRGLHDEQRVLTVCGLRATDEEACVWILDDVCGFVVSIFAVV